MWQRLRELLIIGLSVLAGIVISSLFERLLNPSISFPTGWLDLFLLVLFGTLGVMIWFIVGMYDCGKFAVEAYTSFLAVARLFFDC